mmetsp:Transcript_11108/g.20962  ORF Transcript_11108/g.20962 Transcript_11108/m.20962 type:complete len:258 (-) Transcript_11108:744-1517(-)
MEIRLHVDTLSPLHVRHLKIDHQGDLGHINSAAQDVRRNQNPCHSAAELLHHLVTLLDLQALRLFAILSTISCFRRTADERHCKTIFLHFLCQVEGLLSGIEENDTLAHVQGAINLRQLLVFIFFVHAHLVRLPDASDCQLFFGDLNDGLFLLQQLLRKDFHMVRVRGAEEKNLDVVLNVLPDIHHVVTHPIFLVKHDIRFIKHENFEVVHGGEPLLDHVHHLSRCPNEDVTFNGISPSYSVHARDYQVHLRGQTRP